MSKNSQRVREWRKANQTDYNTYMRGYRRAKSVTNLSETLCFVTGIAEDEIRCRIPRWVDLERIRQLYRRRVRRGDQLGFLIPLVHENVCGLCIPENIKILTSSEIMHRADHFFPEAEAERLMRFLREQGL